MKESQLIQKTKVRLGFAVRAQAIIIGLVAAAFLIRGYGDGLPLSPEFTCTLGRAAQHL